MAELKLRHVSGWTENGWKRISDPSTLDIHPFVTVSARQGLFRCDLCGQNVTLTAESSKRRHFRHAANEANKNCPERSLSSSAFKPNLKEHDLPLRIKVQRTGDIAFEIGFIRLPKELYTSFSVSVTAKTHATNRVITSYVYSQERFFTDSTTYLNVGQTPAGSYSIVVEGGNQNYKSFWPNSVPGVNENGSIFEKDTGIIKTFNSNVAVGKAYFLLTNGRLPKSRIPAGFSYKEISKTKGAFTNQFWTLYEIKASNFDSETAEFFQRYSYRLVEKDAVMTPLWPLYKEGPFSILHNNESMYTFITGDGNIDYYPKTNAKALSEGNGKLVWFHSLERQQIMSIGQYKTLAYSYYWKTELNRPAPTPWIDVLDINENPMPSGDNYELPQSNCLLINSPFFGYIERRNNNRLLTKISLTPSTETIIDNLKFGEEIRIIIGLDCVWSATYIKTIDETQIDELEIINMLNSHSRSFIPAPHALKSMAIDFANYPLINAWIREKIKTGKISQPSFRQLQTFHREIIKP